MTAFPHILYIFPIISYIAQPVVRQAPPVVAAVAEDPRTTRVIIAGCVVLQAAPAVAAVAQVKQEQASVPVAVAVVAAAPEVALLTHGPAISSVAAAAAVVPEQPVAAAVHGDTTRKSPAMTVTSTRMEKRSLRLRAPRAAPVTVPAVKAHGYGCDIKRAPLLLGNW